MSEAKAPKARSLAPREHGAYGQLGVPLAAALAAGSPTVTSVALAAAAVAAFLAHEPVIVLLGGRGPRVKATYGGRARRRLIVLAVVAAALGGLGLALASEAVWVAAAVAGGLGAVTLGLVMAELEKTLVGELVAAGALSSAAVPVAVASGVGPAAAWWMWAAWALGFATITCAVRDVIARGKRKRRWWAPALLVVLVVAAAVLAWRGPVWVRAAAPLVAVAVGMTLAPAAPRRLRQTGWLLVVASVATGGWLVAMAHT